MYSGYMNSAQLNQAIADRSAELKDAKDAYGARSPFYRMIQIELEALLKLRGGR